MGFPSSPLENKPAGMNDRFEDLGWNCGSLMPKALTGAKFTGILYAMGVEHKDTMFCLLTVGQMNWTCWLAEGVRSLEWSCHCVPPAFWFGAVAQWLTGVLVVKCQCTRVGRPDPCKRCIQAHNMLHVPQWCPDKLCRVEPCLKAASYLARDPSVA